jgi:4-hydroxyphenylacetate 3-monooxygenase/4-hydroxybutyryl-CoA dehydratase/vinylacetyl-CoA-Delta-isomerase
MIHDLIGSSFGAHRQIAGLHGGGSPLMEVIAILGTDDLEKRKEMAKYPAGIDTEAKGKSNKRNQAI